MPRLVFSPVAAKLASVAAENAFADAERRIGDWSGRGFGGAFKVRDFHAMSSRVAMHVAGLQRIEFGAARGEEREH